MAPIFNPEILREYDIRGTVDENLCVADALALGQAFGTMVRRAGGKRVVVGYDGRLHSPKLETALVEGLRATDTDVLRIGLGPTPLLYFAMHYARADGGIMVTGSHNPPDQNGFKMLMATQLPGGGPIYGDAIKRLAALAAQHDFAVGNGAADNIDIGDVYVDRLLAEYNASRPLKVVWDCGNGAAGALIDALTKRLPGEHIVLFSDIDGTFPNHHPDPTVAENLQDLRKCVDEHRADLGIGFDGDADRIGAIDQHGRIVAGDQLLAIYASEILENHKGATIIADVKSSQALFDRIAALGGVPIMWKTGHSLIKAKMTETGALLAGEMSGHMFFADRYYGYDDALYAAIRLLSILSASGKSLAMWRDAMPALANTPECRIPVDEARKFQIIDEIKNRLCKMGANVNGIDGMRVTTKDGWWLLRASNTQAALIARAEAKNEAALARLKTEITDHLEECGITASMS